jgi:Fe-S cluster biogenesis protein NfuA
MREKVEQVLVQIRQGLKMEGGDIDLVDLDEEEGVVYVQLKGACAGCPRSQMTLKMFVERNLVELVEGVTRVEQVGGPVESPTSER